MHLIDADGSYTLKASDNTGYGLCFGGSIISCIDERGHVVAEFFAEDAPGVEAVTVRQYEELQAKNDTLKRLIAGEWVDTADVQRALGIDFGTGLKMFDFSRTAEWNPFPQNGQKITTKFRLKGAKAEEGLQS